MRVKAIIVEDEKPAADNLAKLLADANPELEVIACLGSVRDAVAWLRANTTDLIFLDIQLSDGLSFKIFEQVDIKTPVIFTTAYDQYAIKAFETNSVDYLLKPIKVEALQRSLSKFRNIFGNKDASAGFDVNKLLDSLNNRKVQYQQRLMVFSGQKIRSLLLPQVAYFYVVEKVLLLRTFDNENFTYDYSLDKLETMLDPEMFFRVNRQYIVNFGAIKNMHLMSNRSIKIELTPKPDQDVLVSIQRLADFKDWLNR